MPPYAVAAFQRSLGISWICGSKIAKLRYGWVEGPGVGLEKVPRGTKYVAHTFRINSKLYKQHTTTTQDFFLEETTQ